VSRDATLAPLLAALRDAGLGVGVTEVARLQRVFALAPELEAPSSRDQLRSVLRAVVVKAPGDGAALERVFDAWFAHAEASVERAVVETTRGRERASDPEPAPPRTSQHERELRIKRQARPRWVAATLGTVALIAALAPVASRVQKHVEQRRGSTGRRSVLARRRRVLRAPQQGHRPVVSAAERGRMGIRGACRDKHAVPLRRDNHARVGQLRWRPSLRSGTARHLPRADNTRRRAGLSQRIRAVRHARQRVGVGPGHVACQLRWRSERRPRLGSRRRRPSAGVGGRGMVRQCVGLPFRGALQGRAGGQVPRRRLSGCVCCFADSIALVHSCPLHSCPARRSRAASRERSERDVEILLRTPTPRPHL
jgi:uncharacterized protein with von Willebrand factor type A (vWA) domain